MTLNFATIAFVTRPIARPLAGDFNGDGRVRLAGFIGPVHLEFGAGRRAL